MQDEDGGVWQKQTSARFCAFIAPQKDTLVSYVIGTGKGPYKSSCATADFAAVMAIAGRIYKPFDPAYTDRCLRAARLAWTWLEKNAGVIFHNPAGIATGEYGDVNCGDEQLWAAAELWRTTGDAGYGRYFDDHYSAFRHALGPDGPPSWSDVGALALWTYALGHGSNADAVAEIRQGSVAAAQQIVERSAGNPYRVSLRPPTTSGDRTAWRPTMPCNCWWPIC